jgi:hypothetical protein
MDAPAERQRADVGSGDVEAAPSRFAAPSRHRTASPFRIGVPPTSTSSSAVRPVSGNPKWAGNPNWSGKIHDHRFHRFHRNVFFVGGFAGPYYDYGYTCWQWVPTRWGTWTRIWVCDYPNPYGY